MIPLVPDPDSMPKSMPPEPCCFCGEGARTWYKPKDVAVCTFCAETRDPSEVPTKTEWCDAVARSLKDGHISAKNFRALETRWRFLSVCTPTNEFYRIELENQTKARSFAKHLIKTEAARKVTLIDQNHADSGYGWVWAK